MNIYDLLLSLCIQAYENPYNDNYQQQEEITKRL